MNFDKLDKAIDWAIAEDAKAKRGEVSLWRQAHWAAKVPEVDCGTACCIAGNLVAAEGGKFVAFVTDEFYDIEKDAYIEAEITCRAVDRAGVEHDVDEWATEILGTDYAWPIFEAENKIEDIKRIRDSWAVREGVPTRFKNEESN